MRKALNTLLTEKLTRRTFLNSSGKAAAVGAVATSTTFPFTASAETSAQASKEEVKYSACLVNCGSRCPLKVHVKDGVISYIDSEDGINDEVFGEHQITPCLRVRANRYKTYNHDRIKSPLLRVGKRGEGKFKKISWDEATTLIADKLKYTIEKHGNEAIFYQYGTGCNGGNIHGRNAMRRFLSSTGGYLNYHNSYSTAQISRIEPFVYGKGHGSFMSEIANSDLVVMFCQNLAETRMSGGGQIYEVLQALEKSQAKVIIIDPRYTDSSIGLNAEWLPIRPGTDAALVAGIVHTLVDEGLADDDFINKYATGWDEDNLPATAPKNSSYKSYIMGKYNDGIEKTAEWAADLTRIPAARIRQLAREMASANNAWISQGWGLQRTANGEQGCRSIMMLPVITKQFGKPGPNTGDWLYHEEPY
ncbi:molybdopterin-dependent oxidoreductase [Vibrio maerlii]|uniref:molybdopterin-dependent oxidoreductase n=1 Tax=Vibrio maerlii TaxID=2231648 RepID=UPI002402C8B1|nr:molybdopterin-dependent oxidoreductase [Vibrio maerlii]